MLESSFAFFTGNLRMHSLRFIGFTHLDSGNISWNGQVKKNYVILGISVVILDVLYSVCKCASSHDYDLNLFLEYFFFLFPSGFHKIFSPRICHWGKILGNLLVKYLLVKYYSIFIHLILVLWFVYLYLYSCFPSLIFLFNMICLFFW